MTEQEFMRQVWRPYDKITTADGVPGKVLQVAFNTKCVRAFISGAPEWVRCELIESHTTGKGGECDDVAIIEELHNKLMAAQDTIERLRGERQQLVDKLGHNYLGDLLKAVNLIKQSLMEKKAKLALIDSSMERIDEILQKVGIEDDSA